MRELTRPDVKIGSGGNAADAQRWQTLRTTAYSGTSGSAGALATQPSRSRSQGRLVSSHPHRRTPRLSLLHSCRIAALALAAAASLVLTSPTYAIDTSFEYNLNPQHSSDKCLDVQGGSTANSAHLIQFQCHDGPNQRFRFQRIFGNIYEIRPVHSSNKCLDVQGGSTANSAHLIQFQCHDGPNQRFDILGVAP